MQEVEVICTLDEPEHKEYKLIVSDRENTVRVIAWARKLNALEGFWYTIAHNGQPHYFETQEEIIEFVLGDL
jgi:hypothetical protein